MALRETVEKSATASNWPKQIHWILAWNAVAVVMFLRGLARSDVAVPDWQICLVAIGVSAIATLARLAFLRSDREPPTAPDITGFSVGVILYAFWLSGLTDARISLAFIWLLAIASEAYWLSRLFGLLPSSDAKVDEASVPADESDGEPMPPDTDQRLTRRSTESGDELSGLLRVRFQEGQRIAIGHIGFVPPLQPNPVAEAEVVWGIEASVKVADIHAQGVEFELRRERGDTEEGYSIIDLYARST